MSAVRSFSSPLKIQKIAAEKVPTHSESSPDSGWLENLQSKMSGRKPNVKRRIIPSDSDLEDMDVRSPLSKIARTDGVDSPNPKHVPTRSFYGSGSKTYLNPLERKEIPSNRIFSFSPSDNEENDKKITPKSLPRKSKKKKGKTRKKTVKTSSHIKPLNEVIPGSPRSPVKNILETPTDPTEDKGENGQVSTRKFFKTRNTAASRASPPGSRLGIVIKKGFKLTFQAKKGSPKKKHKTDPKLMPHSLEKSHVKRVKPSLSFKESKKLSEGKITVGFSHKSKPTEENKNDNKKVQQFPELHHEGVFEKELSMGLDCDSEAEADIEPFWPPPGWSDRASVSSCGTDSVLLLRDTPESATDNNSTTSASSKYIRKGKIMEENTTGKTPDSPSHTSPRKHPRADKNESSLGLSPKKSYHRDATKIGAAITPSRKSPRKCPWLGKNESGKSSNNSHQSQVREEEQEDGPPTTRRTPRKTTCTSLVGDPNPNDSAESDYGPMTRFSPCRTPRKPDEMLDSYIAPRLRTQVCSATKHKILEMEENVTRLKQDVAESPSLRRTPRKTKRTDELEDTEDKVAKGGKKYFPIFEPKNSPASQRTPTGSSKHSPLLQSLPRQRSLNPASILAKTGKDGREQMILDCGQKVIGAVQCQSCGMTYSIGDPVDESMHSKFHLKFANTLKFAGWKNERVVQEFPDGCRVVAVMPEEKVMMKKVEAVKKIVDEDLGFVASSQPVPRQSTVYLFISDEKKIIGFSVAEHISKAFRVIGENAPNSQGNLSRRSSAWCCKEEPEPAKCGINRIWVLGTERRRKIATKLLECIRGHFLMGYPLRKSDLAFTDPTPDGKYFATKYTGTQSFLVYKR